MPTLNEARHILKYRKWLKVRHGNSYVIVSFQSKCSCNRISDWIRSYVRIFYATIALGFLCNERSATKAYTLHSTMIWVSRRKIVANVYEVFLRAAATFIRSLLHMVNHLKMFLYFCWFYDQIIYIS